MPLLLDAASESAAFQTGYAIGFILGLGLVLGGLAFCIVAVVKAFTRRTTGWIVTGSIAGVILLVFSAIFTVGFINGFTRARRAALQRAAGDQTTPAAGPTQTIQGRDIAYKVVLPAGWETKRGVNDFDLLASYHTLYFGVIAEEGSLGSPETMLDFAQNKLRRAATDIQFSPASYVKIDGRNWLAFSAKCQVQKIPFGYQYAVYAGPEGSYQLVGWTLQNLFDRDAGALRDVAATFRFSTAPAASTAASPGTAAATAAPPQVLVGDSLPYKLTTPAEWMVKRKVGAIDLEVSYHSMYVGVVAEDGPPSTTPAALKAAQDVLRSMGTELQMSEAAPVKIDGRDWLAFNARCKMEGIPFAYHYFVYAGPEGNYRILGWSMQNLYAREASQIDNVAMTFRFPPGAPAAASPAAATPPPATPPPTPALPLPTPARPRRR